MDRVRKQLGLTENWYLDRKKRNVTVAVLDSGMANHPDLREAILTFRDFTRKKWQMQLPYDDYGHGTHVCGILCGNGKMSGGKYQGICPEIQLVVGKVLDQRGDGSAEEMLSGMEWVLEVKKEYDVRLLNLSVGIAQLRNQIKQGKLKEMTERLYEEGILTVCAAGNKGPFPGTLSFLGEGECAISVGCHDGAYFRGDPYRCESYSGRGRHGACPRKPEVVAPGTRIRSCSALWQRGVMEASYEARSGTSMAAPIVTGCLAIALEECPEASPRKLKKILTSTATDLGEPWNKQGWGMVCPRKMVEALRF